MIISIINQKGGVGKSTTAQALATRLANLGNKVLIIDADPQGNISYILNGDTRAINDLYSVLNGTDIKDAIHTINGYNNNLDIIHSNQALSSIELVLKDVGREYTLKKAIEPIKKDYDYIIIDTPPSLSLLTVNALTVSNGVVIPVQASILSLQGVGQLYNTIESIKEYTNPNLSILGILRTRHNNRTTLSNKLNGILNDTAKNINTSMFNTFIRESVTIREAQATHTDLYKYDINNNAVQDYINFTNELLERIKKEI